MTRYAEKNDVDITRLFLWNKEVVIKDPLTGQEVTLYLRLIGDRDMGIAKAYSFRRSAELRRKLKDEGSDEHEAYLNNIGDFGDKETLVASIILLSVIDIAENVRKSVSLKEPKEPSSDSSIERWEEYQKSVDSYPERYNELLHKELDKALEKEKERLRGMEMPSLYNLYKEAVIQKLCAEEVSRAFYEKVLFLSIYKDKEFKSRAFESMEDFLNISTSLKTRLTNEYQSLELGIDLLKKSQEATG